MRYSYNENFVFSCITFCSIILSALSVELTFELPDNVKECFYEDIPKGTKSSIEFQVVTGGQYDVDVLVESPTKQVLFQDTRQQYGQFEFTADPAGIYKFCFSNEFSTYTHKVIYVDIQVGEEPKLPGIGEHYTAMTQMETSAQKVHEDLNSVVDYQTHHRLREAQGRKRAEELNERVLLWAVGETIGILVIAICQVMILKNFFSDKKSTQMGY